MAYGGRGTLPEMAELILAVGITWRISYTCAGDSAGDKMGLQRCAETAVALCRWMARLSRAVVLNSDYTSKFPAEFFFFLMQMPRQRPGQGRSESLGMGPRYQHFSKLSSHVPPG